MLYVCSAPVVPPIARWCGHEIRTLFASLRPHCVASGICSLGIVALSSSGSMTSVIASVQLARRREPRVHSSAVTLMDWERNVARNSKISNRRAALSAPSSCPSRLVGRSNVSTS